MGIHNSNLLRSAVGYMLFQESSKCIKLITEYTVVAPWIFSLYIVCILSEPVLLNVYEAPELIPRNEFCQPM